jgi:hypothetical protein
MTRTLSSDLHARLVAILGTLLVLSLCAYGVGILLMVQETAYRARAENTIRVLTGEVGVLEGKYLVAEESVTYERALALGFSEPEDVTRVARTSVSAALSLRGEI